METVICRNCFAQVEIPDHALEVQCPNCGSAVQAEPRQDFDQEEKDRERIRRIAEAAAAEERLRIAKERETREGQETNRKIRKTYLISVAGFLAIALISVLVAAAENLDGTIAMFLGALLGALAVEAVAFAVPFLLSLWAFSARIKNSGSKKAALVLTRIAAVFGILIWGMMTVAGFVGMEDNGMMGLWGAANLALNLLAFIMPGKVKVQEKN